MHGYRLRQPVRRPPRSARTAARRPWSGDVCESGWDGAAQDQRTTQPPGSGNCDPTPKTAINNTITGNTITGNTITMQGHLPAWDYNGLLQKNASDATGTTFDGTSTT